MPKVPFLESCAGCGGFCEVDTESDYLIADASRANVGDVVSCSQCCCSGVITADTDGRYCLWNETLCEICWAGIIDRVKALIKVG